MTKQSAVAPAASRTPAPAGTEPAPPPAPSPAAPAPRRPAPRSRRGAEAPPPPNPRRRLTAGEALAPQCPRGLRRQGRCVIAKRKEREVLTVIRVHEPFLNTYI